ncbi:MAG: hypothetical protein LBT59_17455 [Clostridiales bacterium]|nr:hypothetical protein [Clostridiales bacterium]
MSDELLAKAIECMDIAAELSGAHLYRQALKELDKADEILFELEGYMDVENLLARCCLDKGEIYWSVCEELDEFNLNLETTYKVAKTVLTYCEAESDIYLTWTERIVWICGLIIDNEEHVSFDVVRDYVVCNIVFFVNNLSFDKSVTVERALRCADLMKKLSQDNIEIAMAQWLAGCAMLCIGKTENKRKAVRLIMGACRVVASKREMSFVAVGEGYVADYHFQRGEYELAEKWYKDAVKHMKTSAVNYSRYIALYSDRIAECQNRM